MLQYILILTQDTQNKSVQMLEHELNQYNNKNVKILSWNLNEINVEEKQINLKSYSSIKTPINISEIALVIKRTWGPIRKKALAICKDLQNKGVDILNSCDFIEWTHSKIAQYETLQHTKIVPNTICFGKKFLEDNSANTDVASEVLDIAKKQLSFPMVFKTAEGCRANGVYLVETQEALLNLITELWCDFKKNNNPEFSSGFLLQEFISTHDDPLISNYYRINLVDGKPQSAVQFQLKWQNQNDLFALKKLVSFDEAENKPVAIEFFNNSRLDVISAACPQKDGVIGVDITYHQDRMYLLEFNDGPVLSEIVELAQKHKQQECAVANAECGSFIKAIASLCMHKLTLQTEEKATPLCSIKVIESR